MKHRTCPQQKQNVPITYFRDLPTTGKKYIKEREEIKILFKGFWNDYKLQYGITNLNNTARIFTQLSKMLIQTVYFHPWFHYPCTQTLLSYQIFDRSVINIHSLIIHLTIYTIHCKSYANIIKYNSAWFPLMQVNKVLLNEPPSCVDLNCKWWMNN